jgi:hypothetical protein
VRVELARELILEDLDALVAVKHVRELLVERRYEGFAFVVEVENAKIVCTCPLAYTSSNKVEWTELIEEKPDGTKQGEPARDFDEIFRDFDDQGHAAVRKAIGDQAPSLDLRL